MIKIAFLLPKHHTLIYIINEWFKNIAIHDKSYTAKIADYERFSEARRRGEWGIRNTTEWKDKINKIKNLENKLQYKGDNDEF